MDEVVISSELLPWDQNGEDENPMKDLSQSIRSSDRLRISRAKHSTAMLGVYSNNSNYKIMFLLYQLREHDNIFISLMEEFIFNISELFWNGVRAFKMKSLSHAEFNCYW
jgi:hypothetical protein